MRPLPFILLTLATLTPLSATPLTPTEASQHIGEKVDLEGLVCGISFMGTHPNHKVYLNFHDYYPRQKFTVKYLVYSCLIEQIASHSDQEKIDWATSQSNNSPDKTASTTSWFS